MANFADDQIISTAGSDANGDYSFPLANQPKMNPGKYFLSVMGTWGTRTIEARVRDRSGNYFVPNDADGVALTAKAANFGVVIAVGLAGLTLTMAGTGTALLTVTMEKLSD